MIMNSSILEALEKWIDAKIEVELLTNNGKMNSDIIRKYERIGVLKSKILKQIHDMKNDGK